MMNGLSNISKLTKAKSRSISPENVYGSFPEVSLGLRVAASRATSPPCLRSLDPLPVLLRRGVAFVNLSWMKDTYVGFKSKLKRILCLLSDSFAAFLF